MGKACYFFDDDQFNCVPWWPNISSNILHNILEFFRMKTFIASKIELCIYNFKPFQKCKEITTTEHYSCNIDKRVFVDLHMDIFVATLTKKLRGFTHRWFGSKLAQNNKTENKEKPKQYLNFISQSLLRIVILIICWLCRYR